MAEIRTLDLLYTSIESEYSWRITELSNFRSSVLSSKSKAQEGLIRAGVALLYAHWEGFVKKISDFYYEFVTHQNCTMSELNDCFVSIALRSKIESLLESKKLVLHNILVREIMEKQDKKVKFSSSSPIKTSNLKYEIFEDVCIMVGIEMSEFHERVSKRGYDRDIKKTIDIDLVDRRNSIAHGNYLSINEKEYKELYNVVVNGLLYTFKESLMDVAQNKLFKRKT